MLKNQCEFEVLVNGKPLKEYSHEGKIFIEGREGTRFAIRMRNNSGSRKLFIPSIDGLSIMNGEKASFSSSGYIVKPYSAVTIEGWRISDNEVNEFFFSDPKSAYATKTKNGDNLGVIGCAVFDEKSRPTPVVIKEYIHTHDHCCRNWCNRCQRYHCGSDVCWWPYTFTNTIGGSTLTLSAGSTTSVSSDSSVSSSLLNVTNTNSNQVNTFNMRSTSQDLGTGWGETKRSEVTSVEFDKESNPLAMFEIFYNTREQLEKLGIDMKKEVVHVAPQAFPGQYCKPPKE